MRNIALGIAVFAAALLSLFGGQEAQAATTDDSKQQRKVITIKRGDTLSKIAKKHKTTYPRVFYANPKIDNPDLIYTGDKVKIPKSDEKLNKRPMEVTKPITTAPQTSSTSYSSASSSSSSNYSSSRASTPAPATTSSYSGPSTSVANSVWDRLAVCESGGNWAINTGNGYYGGLQFTIASWQGVGGTGYPHQASRSEQIKRAEMLLARQGWGAWPACTAKLGLR